MVKSGDTEKGARRFEELWVWQQARELVQEIYEDFRSGIGSKDFGFRDQIQRAGVSVMNNIAEGLERSTDVEFARFLDVARGSCGEVRSMYYAAEDLGTSILKSPPQDVRKPAKFPLASRRLLHISVSRSVKEYKSKRVAKSKSKRVKVVEDWPHRDHVHSLTFLLLNIDILLLFNFVTRVLIYFVTIKF
jgi:four helix bundle protein